MIVELQKLIEEENYHGIINLTKELPANFQGQPDIIRSRAVAFIRLEKYEEALKCIQASPKSGLEFVFEESYCLYRLNKLPASLELLTSALDTINSTNPKSSLASHLSHLKAQVCYRLERFDESLGIYKQLPMDEDVEANIMAVEAVKQACTNNSTFDLAKQKPSSYAGLFNLALYQLSKDDDFQGALKTLEECAQLCASQMAEGYDDLDVEKELLVISSQKAYVLQMLGNKKESLELYEKLLAASKLDPVIVAIATNNSQVLKGAQDVVDVSKALKLIHTPSIIAKLNSSQSFLVELNGLIYSLLNAVAGSKIAQMKEKAGDDPKRLEKLIFLEGSMLVKQGKTSLKEMEQFVADNQKSIASYQYLLDCLLKLNSFNAVESLALTLLENPLFTKYRPGLLSLLVWIFEKSGKNELALDALEKYGHKSSQKSFEELRQLSDFKMKLGRFAEAMQDLDRIYRDFPQHVTIDVDAMRLFCSSQLENSDLKEMRALAEKLEPYCAIEKIDFSKELEQIPGRSVLHEDGKTGKTKKKKKRVKPVPKNYDVNRVPDPERWLPKKMRKGLAAIAENKIKGKGGKEEVSGFGFQGVALKGGGIGSTGSARIAGFKTAPPVAAVIEDEIKIDEVQKPVLSKKSKGKKRK